MTRIFCFLFLLVGPAAQAGLRVAATTSDMAALTREVGQNLVEVTALAKGTQDPHMVEAKPSLMIKLRDVDLVISQGLELETAWLDPLIRGARNPKLAEASRLLELGPSVNPIEVPTKAVTRADGDIHAGGNPHFQLDPIRLGEAGVVIAAKLGELDGVNKAQYMKNAQAFQKRMAEKTADWQARLKKTGLTEVVTYHKILSYFCDRFQVRCHVQLEPKPGVPPTAAHLLSVIRQIKERQIKLVAIENLYDDAAGEKLKQALPGLKVARVAVSVEGEPDLKTNEQVIESLVRVFEGAAK